MPIPKSKSDRKILQYARHGTSKERTSSYAAAGLKWTVGIVIAALAAALTASLTGTFRSLIPEIDEIKCWHANRHQLGEDKSRLMVLVAPLAKDDDGRGLHQIVSYFRGQRGFDVAVQCRAIKIRPIGLQREAEQDAIGEAKSLLTNKHADLLIWGEVVPDRSGLRLWFLTESGACDLSQQIYSLQGIGKETFDSAFSEKLLSDSISTISAACESTDKRDRGRLSEIADKLSNLARAPSPDWSITPTLYDINLFAGEANRILYFETHDERHANRALEFYSKVKTIIEEQHVPFGTQGLEQAVATIGATRATFTLNTNDIALAIEEHLALITKYRLPGDGYYDAKDFNELVDSYIKLRHLAAKQGIRLQPSLVNSHSSLLLRAASDKSIEEKHAAEIRSFERVP